MMERRLDEPDPERIHTLADLARELDRLRLRAAGEAQLRLSLRQLGARIGKSASTIDPYLRGLRLSPADTYRNLLSALGVGDDRLPGWLDAWDRIAAAGRPAAPPGSEGSRPIGQSETFEYALNASPGNAQIGIITGCIRRVRRAQVWVNPENTHMEMARHNESSISAVIRYEGAMRDTAGNVVRDDVADELHGKAAGRRPVAPATVITTGPGRLGVTNGVRHIVHVACVHGEPGGGYRQVLDIGLCVANALTAAEGLGRTDPQATTVLLPLLGTGTGGAPLEPTVRVLLGAALDHLDGRTGGLATVLFLAYTEAELTVCRAAFDGNPRLVLQRT